VLPVFTAEEMRRLDSRAIHELGVPGATLMENAGRGAAMAIARSWPARRGRRPAHIVVVCGKGGNGGDGFVVARWLRRRGVRTSVWLTTPAGDLRGDPRQKLSELIRSGVRPRLVADGAGLARELATADLVVDALLGTGARGTPEDRVARCIELINASERPVVALDIPSGLPADGGAPPGPCVRAASTLTFAGLKRGLVLLPGADFSGHVEVVPIGIPVAEVERDAATFLVQAADVARHVPPRPRAAHKGTYGHVLVIAGSLGKTGAAALTARAAMRSGAGLVTAATAASQQPIVATLVLEAMTEALPETGARSVASKARDAIAELAAARDAVAIGPGLGLDPDTQALAREVVRDVARPMVVDADALTALAGHPEVLTAAAGPRCLTPHPGEMARLLGTTVARVEGDRIGAARELARSRRVCVVLKGALSVIADPDGRVYLNPTGNPGMASGGTGDVLTGIVGAFLARGLAPIVALQAGVFLHGLAGDLAAARFGQEALVASDVIAALPDAFRELQRPRDG
jgi:NAD(P)H-hydrate epimerase